MFNQKIHNGKQTCDVQVLNIVSLLLPEFFPLKYLSLTCYSSVSFCCRDFSITRYKRHSKGNTLNGVIYAKRLSLYFLVYWHASFQSGSFYLCVMRVRTAAGNNHRQLSLACLHLGCSSTFYCVEVWGLSIQGPQVHCFFQEFSYDAHV